ncbi:MAG: hypothetical protein HYY16_17930 [Planctomycetes bacterium]|nr:hypothetical protein [Planctomycetota bacterium]
MSDKDELRVDAKERRHGRTSPRKLSQATRKLSREERKKTMGGGGRSAHRWADAG